MNQQRKPPLDDAERRDRLIWQRERRADHLSASARPLRTAAALHALPDLARRGGRSRTIRICSVAEADPRSPRLPRSALGWSCWAIPNIRRSLRRSRTRRPLGVIGDVALLSQPAIAVVGSRNASLNGRMLARSLARDLGAGGFVIVSGLARGIDAEAHWRARYRHDRGARERGRRLLSARECRALHANCRAGGRSFQKRRPAWRRKPVTFPGETGSSPGFAGRRVVEANLRSGSLITARMALEQGREMFAVPGSPLDLERAAVTT